MNCRYEKQQTAAATTKYHKTRDDAWNILLYFYFILYYFFPRHYCWQQWVPVDRLPVFAAFVSAYDVDNKDEDGLSGVRGNDDLSYKNWFPGMCAGWLTNPLTPLTENQSYGTPTQPAGNNIDRTRSRTRRWHDQQTRERTILFRHTTEKITFNFEHNNNNKI